ncbi:MAG: peptidylprolyl isomerase [Spirochaetia bacterium]|nr:peptidylprolyl isomerase [Spirochaetia bacterium]
MKIKRIILLIIILSAVVVPAFSQMMLQPVAVVNLLRPEMISREALDAKVVELKAANNNQELQESEVLDIMINDILVLQGAEQAGIVLLDKDLNTLVANQKRSVESQVGRSLTDAEFTSVIMQAYGMSMEDLRTKIKQNYIVNAYIRQAKSEMVSNIPGPSEDEIKTFHKKNAASFINSEYIHISHIFISKSDPAVLNPKEKAETVYRQFEYGTKSFDALVLEFSQDESTKFIGGDIGWFAIDDTVSRQIFSDSFFDAVFLLETGEVSSVLESKTGYHIVKILDHTYPKLLSLNDPLSPDNTMTVRQYISQTLYVEKQQKVFSAAVSELVKELRSEAEITNLL